MFRQAVCGQLFGHKADGYNQSLRIVLYKVFQASAVQAIAFPKHEGDRHSKQEKSSEENNHRQNRHKESNIQSQDRRKAESRQAKGQNRKRCLNFPNVKVS